MQILGSDLEWTRGEIDVLGLAWDEGRSCTAVDRNEYSLPKYLEMLKRADVVVGQNYIDADCLQLRKEGVNVDWLVPKVFDTRLGIHATHGHLAGTGSFDLRSMVLLLNGRQGQRFPLDWKEYDRDLHRTCAMDSAAALWIHPTLDRLVRSQHLERTLDISHKCAPVFALMREQGVRLDRKVLEQLYQARKVKTEEIIEKYHLWEYRGKKVVRKVPIWRSNKILDVFEKEFGIRVKDRQRKTWDKLSKDKSLSAEAASFVESIIDLGKGANDAHWLGKPDETEDGLDFSKVGKDGFIHPRYDICGSPDRAIASGPNIQNFVRVSDDPRPVPLRSAVIGLDPSHVMLEVDFSAVETITNAFESNDLDRVKATLDKRISHEGTAAMLNEKFGLNLNRNQGKVVNHGFDKGESPYNLARSLFKTDRPSRQQVLQCQEIAKGILAEYPKTAKFRDQLWDRAQDNPLVVTNSFGRKLMCFSRAKYGDAGERYARHDPYKKYWCSCAACNPRRDRWKYAIAFLGRSTAFDILLRKMSNIYYERRLDTYSLPYIEVHDSLAFSIPKEKAELYLSRAKECFREPVPELGGISLPCEGAIGLNWAQCK